MDFYEGMQDGLNNRPPKENKSELYYEFYDKGLKQFRINYEKEQIQSEMTKNV